MPQACAGRFLAGFGDLHEAERANELTRVSVSARVEMPRRFLAPSSSAIRFCQRFSSGSVFRGNAITSSTPASVAPSGSSPGAARSSLGRESRVERGKEGKRPEVEIDLCTSFESKPCRAHAARTPSRCCTCAVVMSERAGIEPSPGSTRAGRRSRRAFRAKPRSPWRKRQRPASKASKRSPTHSHCSCLSPGSPYSSDRSRVNLKRHLQSSQTRCRGLANAPRPYLGHRP